MGVAGLLKTLKSVGTDTSIEIYKDQCIGIDGYSWLHKSAATCAQDLALGNPTTKFIDYFERRIQLLQQYKIKPFVVFDGDKLPTKSSVENDREKNRLEAKTKAMNLLREGKVRQAQDQFLKAVDVSPTMAAMVIEMLKRRGISYIVAPYEADAQLVYLERKGYIQGIISEDSDLLIFGAQCLITKMDHVGKCIEIRRDKFHKCTDMALGDFSAENLRTMAILSGCDYSPGIPGIGPVKAYNLVRRYREYERLIQMVRMEGNVKVPDGFDDIYKRATLTFQYQRVFCIEKDKLVTLTEITEEITTPEFDTFIGPEIETELSREIAKGIVDPITKQKIIVPFLKNTGMAHKTFSTPVGVGNGTVGNAFHAIRARRVVTSPATGSSSTKPITSFFTSTQKFTPKRTATQVITKSGSHGTFEQFAATSPTVRGIGSNTITPSKSFSQTSTSITQSTPSRVVLSERSSNISTPNDSILSKRLHKFIDSDSESDGEFDRSVSSFFAKKSITPTSSNKSQFSDDSSDSSPEKIKVLSPFTSPYRSTPRPPPTFTAKSNISLDRFIYSEKH